MGVETRKHSSALAISYSTFAYTVSFVMLQMGGWTAAFELGQ